MAPREGGLGGIHGGYPRRYSKPSIEVTLKVAFTTYANSVSSSRTRRPWRLNETTFEVDQRTSGPTQILTAWENLPPAHTV